MRIGVDIRVLARGETTGIQVYTRELLPRLFESGKSHEFVLFYNARRRVPLPRAWRRHPRVTIAVSSTPNKLFDISATVVRRPRVDDLVGGLDLFFQPHFLRAPLSPDCPRVVAAHDCSFEHEPAWFSWRSRFWHARMRPRHRFGSATHIIAVSESTRRDLLDLYGIPPDRITTVPSGVTYERFARPDSVDRYDRWLNTPGDFFLLFSALDHRKNVLGVIAAYERFRRCVNNGADTHRIFGLEVESRKVPRRALPDLVIAGAEGAASSEIARRRQHSSARENIHIVGRIPERMKPALLQRARCLLFPSFFEGFGFPPLEALSSSTPVIAGDRGALPEVLGDHAVLVDPWDSDGLADAMVSFWEDEQLQSVLRREGLSMVRRYSWDSAARQTLAVFDHVRSQVL